MCKRNKHLMYALKGLEHIKHSGNLKQINLITFNARLKPWRITKQGEVALFAQRCKVVYTENLF